MTSRNILTVGLFGAAAVTATVSAQVTIYTCNFDQPPYALGSIDGQNSWVTAQATALAPGLQALRIVSGTGTLAPQAGNGCFFSENGPDATTSGRFAYQFGAGTPIIDAIATACAANATAIEFTCYMVPPSPATNGTVLVGARHGMVLYVVDPTGANTNLKAAAGFQCRSFDSQVFVVQWLDVGQLGVGVAGNYLINFTTPLTLTAGQWNLVGCKWDRATGTPNVKINAGEWTPVVTTSIVNYVPREFDIVNTRGSTSGGASNTQVSTAYMDTLEIVSTQPGFPQCSPTAGDCDTAHASGGCNDAGCCDSVCQLQPTCCSATWDQSCVDLAIPTCNLFVYNCTSPGTPPNNCAISPATITPSAAPIAYNTTTATTDGPPQPQCNSSENDTPIHKDVWYRFQAATDGSLIASNCSTATFGGSGNFDSKIALYDLGTNLAAFDPQLLPDYFVACNEDCDDPLFTSTLEVAGIVSGRYYLVRLGGYQGESGTGNIVISLVPPPNPCDPANIINGVAGTQTVTVDPLYGDLNMQTFCNFTFGTQAIANAKFIKFTPSASGQMTVQNCADTGATVDSRLAAMTECGVVSSTVACDDDGCTGAAPYTSKLVFNAVAGQTYYIAVGGFDNGATGPFNIEIIPPTAPPCPADLNDDNVVNGADLTLLLGSWGACPGCAADLNADGVVNGADLTLLLGSWGACP